MTTGDEKPGPDGTDRTAMGSEHQSAVPSRGANRPQQRDLTGKMDQLRRQDTVTSDHWFDRQLHQLYSEVVSEPLPKDMQELIDKLREKAPQK